MLRVEGGARKSFRSRGKERPAPPLQRSEAKLERGRGVRRICLRDLTAEIVLLQALCFAFFSTIL